MKSIALRTLTAAACLVGMSEALLGNGMARLAPRSPRSAFAVRALKKKADEGVQGTGLEPVTLDAIPGYWELEEDENDSSMHTLVHLLPDGDVEFGRTDGPLPASVQARWRVTDEATWAFELSVKRHFSEEVNVKFPYDVERVYRGYIEDDKGLRTVSGAIVIPEPGRDDINPGFFMLTNVPEFPEDTE
ncbi:hypothetical protein KFE25_005558 [Diacronema lutheri]|uniref:Plastid lipid-associated protein/fibrillin conserved domain-containing protein n=1 Tax=Diacronema lutheri TaxID=2081491 RepID=A0A8J5XJS4_DIALT|nr:hypothetical protein KFE25_005558 [Diacronema lutheri]